MPAAIFLMLGEREEEAILLCRSIRKRSAERLASIPVMLVSRGGNLVESELEARENGADFFVENLDPLACLQHLNTADVELLDIEVEDVVESLEFIANDAAEPSAPAEQAAAQQLMVSGGLALQRTAVAAMELAEKLSQARSADYFTLLGLDPHASLQEVQDAHRQLSRRFRPEGAPGSAGYWALSEISETLAEAALVLSNERLRRRYRDALVRLDGGGGGEDNDGA